MRLREPARRATAYHEAGHAVAAWSLGAKVYRASIVPRSDAHGSVQHSNPLRGTRLECDGSDRARLRAERAVVICLAGPEAQRRFNPRSWHSWHGQSDHALAVDSEEAASAHLKRLEYRTRDLVTTHWPAIESLALELLNRGTVTGHEAQAAIMQATTARF